MSKFEGLYTIRDGTADDFNFVISTFLRGLYYGDSWFSVIPKRIFMDNYKKAAERLITSDKVLVKVACLPDDSSVILGYSMLSSDYQTVHFVFVKSAWRGKGIAWSLVPRHPSTVSHLTKLGLQLLSKLPNCVFDPFNLPL